VGVVPVTARDARLENTNDAIACRRDLRHVRVDCERALTQRWSVANGDLTIVARFTALTAHSAQFARHLAVKTAGEAVIAAGA
jgi:hypothetical protein